MIRVDAEVDATRGCLHEVRINALLGRERRTDPGPVAETGLAWIVENVSHAAVEVRLAANDSIKALRLPERAPSAKQLVALLRAEGLPRMGDLRQAPVCGGLYNGVDMIRHDDPRRDQISQSGEVCEAVPDDLSAPCLSKRT